MTSTHSYLSATAGILSCGAPQVYERVGLVVEERKKANKRVESLEEELANRIAQGLLVGSSSSEEGNDDGPVVRHYHRTDDTSSVLGFLSSISSAFTCQIEETRSYLLVLSSSPSMPSGSSITVVMVLGKDASQVKVVGDALKKELRVKGGGQGTKWSGKFIGVYKENREGATIDLILQRVNTGKP